MKPILDMLRWIFSHCCGLCAPPPDTPVTAPKGSKGQSNHPKSSSPVSKHTNASGPQGQSRTSISELSEESTWQEVVPPQPGHPTPGIVTVDTQQHPKPPMPGLNNSTISRPETEKSGFGVPHEETIPTDLPSPPDSHPHRLAADIVPQLVVPNGYPDSSASVDGTNNIRFPRSESEQDSPVLHTQEQTILTAMPLLSDSSQTKRSIADSVAAECG